MEGIAIIPRRRYLSDDIIAFFFWLLKHTLHLLLWPQIGNLSFLSTTDQIKNISANRDVVTSSLGQRRSHWPYLAVKCCFERASRKSPCTFLIVGRTICVVHRSTRDIYAMRSLENVWMCETRSEYVETAWESPTSKREGHSPTIINLETW